MHSYPASFPSGYIAHNPHSASTHAYPYDTTQAASSSSTGSFSLGSSSYSDHEASTLPIPSSGGATGLAFSTSGYPYPTFTAATMPLPGLYSAPHFGSGSLNPLKTWGPLVNPTSAAASFFKAVPPGGMAILPPYHSATRVVNTRSDVTALPVPNAPVAPVPVAAFEDSAQQELEYPPPSVSVPYPTLGVPEAHLTPPPSIDGQSADNNHHKKHQCWMCHKSFDRCVPLSDNLTPHPHR